jgi:Xaa-Pro aminopeptidase
MVWVPPLPGVLTGCEHAAVVLGLDGSAALIVTDVYSDQVAGIDVRRNANLQEELISTVRDLGLTEGRVGVIGQEVLPFALADALRSMYPSLLLITADEISARLRFHLSDAEVALLQHAGAVGKRIYETYLAAAAPGRTEGEAVGAALAEAAQTPGCAHWSFLSAAPDPSRLTRGGILGWTPEYRYSSGDVIHADCYGFVRGYVYDIARTRVVGGGMPHEQHAVAEATRCACDAIAGVLAPGKTCHELSVAAVSILSDFGLQSISPSIGHGIGAGFFRPYLVPNGPDAELILEPPCGLSIEIFATTDRGFYAYHEDNFIVLRDRVICTTC